MVVSLQLVWCLAFFPGLLLFFHFSSQNFAKRRHTTDDDLEEGKSFFLFYALNVLKNIFWQTLWQIVTWSVHFFSQCGVYDLCGCSYT